MTSWSSVCSRIRTMASGWPIGWLDVVRFADTIGYHSDTPRNVWPYRDWVIKSFNDNKPFRPVHARADRRRPACPTRIAETRVGSAFNRLLLTTEEGGAQAKDYEARMLTDRVRAIGAAWLGQTTGCAQCHDHKFDPFTQRDFYSLGRLLRRHHRNRSSASREEGMVVATPEQEQRSSPSSMPRIAQAKKQFDAIVPAARGGAAAMGSATLSHTESHCPNLPKDSKAAAADKELARQVTEFLKKEPAERTAPRKQKHCKPTSARRRRSCLRPSAKRVGARPRPSRKPFTTPCRSAWSASAVPTSAPCASCRAATGWTKAARW